VHHSYFQDLNFDGPRFTICATNFRASSEFADAVRRSRQASHKNIHFDRYLLQSSRNFNQQEAGQTIGKGPLHAQYRSGVIRGDQVVKFSDRRACGALVAALGWANTAIAQDVSVDPQGSGVLVSAMHWLEGTLLGTVATVVAVIAVASVGLLMLTGRINWRYGATVILGCFILFGAASIVAGIQSTAQMSQ
jgi:type IV secretion system protein VirB2